MGLLVRALDGEIVEIGTGICRGFENIQFPQLTTDANTLLRHFDGVSAESLGSIPKIITISRTEQRLLSKIRPWKWLKYAVNQDYLALIDKINHQRFSLFCSIRMKNLWADPDSIFNTPEHRLRKSLAMKALWRDPIYRQNIIDGYTSERRLVYSERQKHQWTIPEYRNNIIQKIKARWADPDSYYNSPEYRLTKSLAMIEYCEDPNCVYKSAKFRAICSMRSKERWADPNSGVNAPGYAAKISKAVKLTKGTPEARRRASIATKRSRAWRKLPQVMEMLFGGIVDEDAEAFPCPHCNRVFSSKKGVAIHKGQVHRAIDDRHQQYSAGEVIG